MHKKHKIREKSKSIELSKLYGILSTHRKSQLTDFV